MCDDAYCLGEMRHWNLAPRALQRTGGFHRYEDPGRFPIDQAAESVGYMSGTFS